MPTTKTKTTQIRKADAKPVESSLTPIQEQLAHLAGDMILNPAHGADVDRLLRGAMGHYWRSRSADVTSNEAEQGVKAFIQNHLEDWRLSLIQSWPAPQPDGSKAEPTNISELIRQNFRGELTDHFTYFLGNATPEEIRFLNGVLNDWLSGAGHSLSAPQLEIANSFEREIGRGVRWVRVPSRALRDKVVGFLSLLTTTGKVT